MGCTRHPSVSAHQVRLLFLSVFLYHTQLSIMKLETRNLKLGFRAVKDEIWKSKLGLQTDFLISIFHFLPHFPFSSPLSIFQFHSFIFSFFIFNCSLFIVIEESFSATKAQSHQGSPRLFFHLTSERSYVYRNARRSVIRPRRGRISFCLIHFL